MHVDRLLAAVLAEAKMCCSGQPIMIVGDLNADSSVIFPLLKAWQMELGLMKKKLLPGVEECPLSPLHLSPHTCQILLDECKGTRRDFALACPHCNVGQHCMWRFARTLVPSHIWASARTSLSPLGTPLSRWPGISGLYGLLAGYNVLTVPNGLRQMWYETTGRCPHSRAQLCM